jgi:TRAP-type mannitol/chloroaromatic compound transport system permease small subunit
MRWLQTSLNAFIRYVGYGCGVLMLLMLLNVFADVVMRYVFNDVSIGMQELEWHLFSAMFMFGIGYTLKVDGHVRVDVFYERWSAKTRAWINLLGTLVFIVPISILIIDFGWQVMLEAYSMGEGSGDPGGLPHRFIIKGVVPVAFIYLLLCAVSVVLDQVAIIRAPAPV